MSDKSSAVTAKSVCTGQLIDLCECVNWARSIPTTTLTNHHPNCPRYNESLIDVWKVTDGTLTCVFDNQCQAQECLDEDTRMGVEGLRIEQTKMHREEFESLGEFEGF